MRRREKNKRKDKIRRGSSLAATSVMIILMVVSSVIAISQINHIEERKSIERLYEEADDLADTIETYAQSDREALEVLAEVIAQYDDLHSEELWELLDSFSGVGLMSEIELLLPDDTVLKQGGRSVDAEGIISFKEEAAHGAFISDREMDIEVQDKYIVRHCVPIIRDGQTVAMLNGIIDLGEMPEGVSLDPYGGKAALYLIDGNNGDFLIDTWHPGAGGNMWELGERKMAKGFNSEKLKKGVADGDSAYVIFVSKTIGEYLYFYYEPMQINEWRIAVSVPESVVFENAYMIRRALNAFLLFEMICFVMYYLWMIWYVRRATGEKQRQLEMLNDIYDVEKLLFNAHEKQENIWAALKKVGDIIFAEKVGFWAVTTSKAQVSYLWDKRLGVQRECEEEYFIRLQEYFKQGHSSFEAYNEQELKELFQEHMLKGIYNMAAVPVEDMDGNVCGILAGCNLTTHDRPGFLLKNMVFSFGMFCHNLKSFNDIREERDRDALTGLYNRNRYERDTARFREECEGPLACIYIDVNGLHEMNNAAGHHEGDVMLRNVALEIKKQFAEENTYRIGGDEFVVFVAEADKAEIEKRVKKLTEALWMHNYHISVGMEYEKSVTSIEVLIKSAEKKMYEEKRKYYSNKAHNRRRVPRG